jgi:hypothetical protein
MVCGQMLCPDWIVSKMMLHAIKGDPERAKKILGRTPMNCFGTAADIGLATTYLCPPAARFVTGVVLPVKVAPALDFDGAKAGGNLKPPADSILICHSSRFVALITSD